MKHFVVPIHLLTKQFAFTFLSLLCSVSTISAKNFYIKAGGGYIHNVGKSAYNNADPNGLTSIQPSTDIKISSNGSTATVKSLSGTLGSGFKFGLTACIGNSKSKRKRNRVEHRSGLEIIALYATNRLTEINTTS